MGLDPSADGLDHDRGADEEARAGDIFSSGAGRETGSGAMGCGRRAAWAWDRAFMGRGFFFFFELFFRVRRMEEGVGGLAKVRSNHRSG